MYIFQVIADYYGVFLFGFGVSVVLTLLALKVFPKLGLMDRPHLYNLLRKPIPYYGGIVVYLAFLVSMLVFVPLEKNTIGLLVGATMIFAVGFFDDLLRISPFVRLAVQFAAGVVLIYFGIGIMSFNVPFLGVLDLTSLDFSVFGMPVLSAIFTVVWIMFFVNALNLLDGVSGLNSGITSIAAFTIFVLSIHPFIHENPASQVSTATTALIVSAVALGFFLFDMPKPRILMGDSGSTLFGFLLGALAIFSGGKMATAFLVLGLPIIDLLWAVIRRTLSGKKFWEGDLLHLHHRLLQVGISESWVVFVYLVISGVLGVSAVSFVNTYQKFFVILAFLFLMVLLISALIFLPKKKNSSL